MTLYIRSLSGAHTASLFEVGNYNKTVQGRVFFENKNEASKVISKYQKVFPHIIKNTLSTVEQ